MIHRSKERSDDCNTMTIPEVTRDYKCCYLITFAKHRVKDYVSKEDLDTVHGELKKVISHFYMPLYAYEISPKYLQLHLHGLAFTKKPIRYKNYNSILGFRIQWKPCYNKRRAIDYIYKDATNKWEQEQILDINYYLHHFSFTKEAMELYEYQEDLDHGTDEINYKNI